MRWIFILFCCCAFKVHALPISYKEAEELFRNRKFLESAERLSLLLDYNPELIKARSLLARCLFVLGNRDQGVQELNFLLTITIPNSREYLDALLLLGTMATQYDDISTSNYYRGLNAWKNFLNYTNDRELKEKISKSIINMQKLHNPADAVLIARFYISQSRIAKAILILERTCEMHPRYAPAWHYLGAAFIISDNSPRAIKCWNQVIALNPAYAKKFKIEERLAVARQLIAEKS